MLTPTVLISNFSRTRQLVFQYKPLECSKIQILGVKSEFNARDPVNSAIDISLQEQLKSSIIHLKHIFTGNHIVVDIAMFTRLLGHLVDPHTLDVERALEHRDQLRDLLLVVEEVPQSHFLLVGAEKLVVLVVELHLCLGCMNAFTCLGSPELKHELFTDKIILINLRANSQEHDIHGNLGSHLDQLNLSQLPIDPNVECLELNDPCMTNDRRIDLWFFKNHSSHVQEFVVCLDNSFVKTHLVILESKQLQNSLFLDIQI